MSDGQIITGLVVPQPLKAKDYFIVSTYNEEKQENLVGVYRKNKLQFSLGPFTENSMILDLKMIGKYLFIPKSSHMIERQEIKGF